MRMTFEKGVVEISGFGRIDAKTYMISYVKSVFGGVNSPREGRGFQVFGVELPSPIPFHKEKLPQVV
jgi:hypothetical protein